MTLTEQGYMQLGMHTDRNKTLWLKVPTYWDESEQSWIGFVHTPITRKMIVGIGKNSRELEHSFNMELKKCIESSAEMAEEIVSMYKEES